jgi:hypothetical protein
MSSCGLFDQDLTLRLGEQSQGIIHKIPVISEK